METHADKGKKIIAFIVSLAITAATLPSFSIPTIAADATRTLTMSDFRLSNDAQNSRCTIADENGGIVLSKRDGDTHAMTNIQASVFTFQADIEILDGKNGLLVIGASNRDNPSSGSWYGIGPNRGSSVLRLFKVDNGLPIDEYAGLSPEQDAATSFNLKVTVDSQKVIRAYYNNELMIMKKDDGFIGGYIGILSYQARVKFTNVKLSIGDTLPDINNFNTNLTNLRGINGTWAPTSAGMNGYCGLSDSFAMSDTTVTDFIYEAKVKINSGWAASLVFRSNDTGNNAYVANVDLYQKNTRIFKFTGQGHAVTLGNYALPDPTLKEFTLRVECKGPNMNYYVNGILAVQCVDSQFSSGKLGLLVYNSNSFFQDVLYSDITASTPCLTGLTSSNAILSPNFDSSLISYSTTVPSQTDKLMLSPTAQAGTKIYISSAKSDGTAITSKKEVTGDQTSIKLDEGVNIILITTEKDGKSGITTQVSAKREYDPTNYRTEKYRPQFHVTPETNWLNDPNGMVYYKGEYHLFYQYNPYTKFPGDEKFWGHVVSTDLVNWKELPIALSPDQYGSIWSGSCVVDINNSSGLFGDTEDQTGLVAYYTVTKDGNATQRQAMAYSKDKGRTWIKYNDGAPIIDNSADPFHDNGGFRDPKVFWHEESNKWMMIVAGGPVRFFSSTDMINWSPEGMQGEIHTECPDFFKLPVDGNPANSKWVLSGGGSWYMIGDFKLVGEVWKFVPDSNERIKFNCGPDVYAAQTFSDTPNRRIKVDWMVNISYPFECGNITDPWNGALTLPYELTLKTINGKIRILQNPVSELDILHTKEHKFTDISVSDTTPNPIRDLQLGKFRIRATIDIGTANEFGFNIRAGNNQYTSIKYNKTTQLLTVDRTKSGAIPTPSFAGTYSTRVEPINGKIELQMLVDWSSLELFAQGGIHPFTVLIFPDSDSVGLEFFASGGTAKVDNMSIYELKSIFREEEPKTTDPTSIKTISSKNTYNVGDQFTVWAVSNPFTAKAPAVNWNVSDNTVFEIVAVNYSSIVLKALKNGDCSITAEIKTGGLQDNLELSVKIKDFKTNITGWAPVKGSWQITENGYEGTGGGNSQVISTKKAADFEYESKVTLVNGTGGAAMIFRANDDMSVYYTADICETNRNARILRFHRDPITGNTSDITLGNAYTLPITDDHTYNLKVVANGTNLQLFVNGELAADTNNSESLSGAFGLNVCDMDAIFQDVYYKEKLVGDINDDGKVTVTDVVSLRSIIMGDSTPDAEQFARGDLNNDGELTVTDIVAVRAIIMD